MWLVRAVCDERADGEAVPPLFLPDYKRRPNQHPVHYSPPCYLVVGLGVVRVVITQASHL